MSSVRSIARRAAVLGASISLVAVGVLAASSPAQAATCTVTPVTGPDLELAFSNAPATGAVICLGADITVSGASGGLAVPSGAAITLDLNGRTLTALGSTVGARAGITVGAGQKLTVDATGGGSLTSTGSSGGAGIGGDDGTDAGTIVINGGTISATSVANGAGIGGGFLGAAGTIVINGGNVTATSLNAGAGIGAGEQGSNGGSLLITGGTVTAQGSLNGAGIGGGLNAYGPDVTITGGVVDAQGEGQGAGIGGGGAAQGTNVELRRGVITARGGSLGAAVGAGGLFSPGTLTIYGSGPATPTSGSYPGVANSAAPTVQAGPAGVSFTQTTQEGSSTQRARTQVVFAVATAPQITTTTVANATVGVAYSQAIVATGTGPIIFALANGSTLPDGLILDPNTGFISGTPTAAGSYSFEISATNSAGVDTKPYSVAIAAAPVITTTTVANATVGIAYSQTIAATGTGPITFALANGTTLPAGLTLDGATGSISGTPTVFGTFSFTITATNATGADSRSYTMDVAATAATPTPAPSSTSTAGSGSSKLAVTGGDGAVAPLLLVVAALLLATGAGILLYPRVRRQP